MQKNILLAGVGGQGILSQAFVMCNAALEEGLNFKQAEVHGMAQRGGAVQSNLRISSEPIMSDLIPRGTCDILLSVEPLEALRYLDYLGKDGTIITSTKPFVNIPNYPEVETIWAEFEKVPHVIPVNAEILAKEAGSPLSANMVMLGAAAPFLGLKIETLENWVRNLWSAKGDKVAEVNARAFHAGREMAEFLTEVKGHGVGLKGIHFLADNLNSETKKSRSASEWADLLRSKPEAEWIEAVQVVTGAGNPT